MRLIELETRDGKRIKINPDHIIMVEAFGSDFKFSTIRLTTHSTIVIGSYENVSNKIYSVSGDTGPW